MANDIAARLGNLRAEMTASRQQLERRLAGPLSWEKMSEAERAAMRKTDPVWAGILLKVYTDRKVAEAEAAKAKAAKLKAGE